MRLLSWARAPGCRGHDRHEDYERPSTMPPLTLAGHVDGQGPCLLYAPPPRGCEVAMAHGRPLLSHAPLTFRFILGRGDELRSALQLQHIDQMDNTYIIVPIPTNKWIIHTLPKQHGYGFGYGHWLSRCLAELVCYK